MSSARLGRAYAPAWLALLAGLMVSVAVARWLWREGDDLDQARFQTAITNLMEHLDARTERYAEQLERLADLAANVPELAPPSWNELVTRLSPPSNLPAFLELVCLTNSIPFSRAEVEASAQTYQAAHGVTGLPPLEVLPPPVKIASHWRNDSMITAGQTENWLHHSPIGNWWNRIASGRMVSTPRRLIPDTNGAPVAAVSLLVPLFEPDLAEMTAAFNTPDGQYRLRKHRFKGLVIGTIGWQKFLETALPAGAPPVAFEAFADAVAANEISAGTWMGEGGVAPSQALSKDFNPRFKRVQTWLFYREKWQLVFFSTRLFDLQSTRYRAWIALSGGASLSILVGGLLAFQVRARRAQEAISSQLRRTLEQLSAARKERERLSQDLHDGAIQSLYAMQLSVSRAAELAESAQPILGRRLSDIRRNLSSVIVELRSFILQHEAESGPSGDLASVLSAVLDRLRSSTETVLKADLSSAAGRRLTDDQAVHLANLGREALSNALRHARASQVTVTLRQDGSHVVLEIRDDGCGFDLESPPKSGVGLSSMAARAREAGGDLRLESRPGAGACVSVTVPVAGRMASKQSLSA